MALHTKKGTAALPAFSFNEDATTGYDSLAAGQLDLVVSGVSKVQVTSAGIASSSPMTTGVLFPSNVRLGSATAGAAGASDEFILRKTGIVDAAATSILRVTCPNVNAAAILEVTILATIGNTAAAENSTRVVKYMVAFTRTAGANLAAAASSAIGAAIATVAAGATITATAAVTSVTGGVTASNTIDVQVTVTVSAGTPTHNVTAIVRLINSETGGMTMAAV